MARVSLDAGSVWGSNLPRMHILVDQQGRIIRLTDERLAHILEHPEMRSLESAIAWAVALPDHVVTSLSDPSVQLYYRYHPRTLVGGKYVCVVVKTTSADAFVLTAYLTDSVKKGAPVWQIDM